MEGRVFVWVTIAHLASFNIKAGAVSSLASSLLTDRQCDRIRDFAGVSCPKRKSSTNVVSVLPTSSDSTNDVTALPRGRSSDGFHLDQVLLPDAVTTGPSVELQHDCNGDLTIQGYCEPNGVCSRGNGSTSFGWCCICQPGYSGINCADTDTYSLASEVCTGTLAQESLCVCSDNSIRMSAKTCARNVCPDPESEIVEPAPTSFEKTTLDLVGSSL